MIVFVCIFVNVQYSQLPPEPRRLINKISNFSIPTAPARSVPCNFDYGLCYGWSQSRSDIFDWTRQRGSTSSLNTGPSSDHTTGKGTYNYNVNSSTRGSLFSNVTDHGDVKQNVVVN